MIGEPVEIIEGHCGGEYTNIYPIMSDPPNGPEVYCEKLDEEISIIESNLLGYLGDLLNKYYCREIQLDKDNRTFDMFDSYGDTYYLPDQIRSVLSELSDFIEVVANNPFDPLYVDYFKNNECNNTIPHEAAVIVDFYTRFIARMEKMLQNMDGYDLILFNGP